MVLFQLILQVIVLCAIVGAVAFGLLAAPWYVLVAFLLAAFLVTRWLMPRPDAAIATVSADLNPEFSKSPSGQPTQPPTDTTLDPNGATSLTYRGAKYSTTAIANAADERSAGPPLEMKYRGVKVNLHPDNV